jgi:CRP-like cAMP-binding protein
LNFAGDGSVVNDPLLRTLEHAGPLTPDERAELQNLTLKQRSVRARLDLGEGDSDCVYLVLSGFACRYKVLQTGERRIVSFVLPGDLCYMHDAGVFGRDLRVGTLTRCTVADISRTKLVELISAYPGIQRALWWVTLRELSRAREWIVNGIRPAEQHLAHLLCELLVCLQVVGLADENSFVLPLSQSDVADALGISPVHTNRVLRTLREGNLATWSRHRVVIPDVRRLKTYSEFDQGYLCFGGLAPQPNVESTQPLLARA